MKVNELAKDIHANAVAHGWWDDERKAPEIVALIHSEWSEALEEARAGRPLVWYRCNHKPVDKICGFLTWGECELRETEDCPRLRGKPEGIAVELIDGCIRIFDAFEFFGVNFKDDKKTLDDLMDEAEREVLPKCEDISDVIAFLHYETSMLFGSATIKGYKIPPATFILGALGIALAWVRKQGLDPMAILLEKHEYNKGRPYKHGKKF